VTIIAAGQIVAQGTPEDLGEREKGRGHDPLSRRDGEEVTIETVDPVRGAEPPHRRGAGARREPTASK